MVRGTPSRRASASVSLDVGMATMSRSSPAAKRAATLRTAQIAVVPVPSPTTIPDVKKLVACSAAARFRVSRSST